MDQVVSSLLVGSVEGGMLVVVDGGMKGGDSLLVVHLRSRRAKVRKECRKQRALVIHKFAHSFNSPTGRPRAAGDLKVAAAATGFGSNRDKLTKPYA